MQRDAAMGRQRLEELAHQLGVEGADLGRGEVDVPDEEGPRRQVERASTRASSITSVKAP
jgi:hypothetical protein